MRVRDGEPLLTDGPFAETREQLGGFYLRRRARTSTRRSRWAAKIPGAPTGCVEVRPVMDYDGARAPRLAAGGAAARGLSVPADVVDRLFRRESAQAVAALARALGDLDRAEEAVQDAFAAALERWPRDGVPGEPGGLDRHGRARNRAIDRIRADRRWREPAPRRSRGWSALIGADETPSEEPVSPIPDERLRLIFTCCHPALAPEARVALTLRLLGGLTTAEVARAFLVSETAMAQRSCGRRRRSAPRASRYELPRDADLPGPPAAPCWRRSISSSTRATRDGRRRADPARAVRGGDPARARARAR